MVVDGTEIDAVGLADLGDSNFRFVIFHQALSYLDDHRIDHGLR